MSCTVFVEIKYSKELVEKIKKIPGIIPKNSYRDLEAVEIPDELFSQHKKESDAHKWVKGKNGSFIHFSQNKGKWIYKSHGFDIWLGFEEKIVFMVNCHWSYNHGEQTILDIEQWIKDRLSEEFVGMIIEKRVTY